MLVAEGSPSIIPAPTWRRSSDWGMEAVYGWVWLKHRKWKKDPMPLATKAIITPGGCSLSVKETSQGLHIKSPSIPSLSTPGAGGTNSGVCHLTACTRQIFGQQWKITALGWRTIPEVKMQGLAAAAVLSHAKCPAPWCLWECPSREDGPFHPSQRAMPCWAWVISPFCSHVTTS